MQRKQNKNPNYAQENQLLAKNLTFYDPDEWQIIKSYENEAHRGRWPPEFDPQTNTYTYAIDRGANGEYRTQFYHTVEIKPYANTEAILKYHESEEY